MKDSNQRKYKNPPGGCSSSRWRQWGSQGWPWQGGPPAWTRWRGGRGTPAADGGWPPRLAGAMAGAGGGAGARRGPGWGSSGPAHGAADGPPDNTPAWKGGFTHWLHCATIDPTCSTNPQHETSTIQARAAFWILGSRRPQCDRFKDEKLYESYLRLEMFESFETVHLSEHFYELSLPL